MEENNMKKELNVNHQGKTLTFLIPAFGPAFLQEIKETLDEEKLSKPTTAETLSLMNAIINTPNEGKRGYRDEQVLMNEDEKIWTFTGVLYTPKGVYIKDNPDLEFYRWGESDVESFRPIMEESELVNRLKGDNPVRFVPIGYKTGRITPRELREHPYVTALIGKEKATRLAELADNLKIQVTLDVRDEIKERKFKKAFYSFWKEDYPKRSDDGQEKKIIAMEWSRHKSGVQNVQGWGIGFSPGIDKEYSYGLRIFDDHAPWRIHNDRGDPPLYLDHDNVGDKRGIAFGIKSAH